MTQDHEQDEERALEELISSMHGADEPTITIEIEDAELSEPDGDSGQEVNGDDGEDDPEGDETPEDGEPEDGEEPEKPERSHLLTRKERRERQKRAREYNRQRLEQLEKLNAQLQQEQAAMMRRFNEVQLSVLDQEIAKLDDNYRHATYYYDQAIVHGDDNVKAEAERIKALLIVEKQRRLEAKQQLVQSVQAPVAPRVNQDVSQHFFENFVQENPWFKFDARTGQGVNKESRLAMTIDRQLVSEGYNPNTAAYWNELQRRVDDFVDEGAVVAQKQKPEVRKQKGGPVVGQGRKGTGTTISVPKAWLDFMTPEEIREAIKNGKKK